MLHAERGQEVRLPTAGGDAPTLSVVAIHDPRYPQPLLLATTLPALVSVADLRALYVDRWPVEQIPLVAKQMIGAERAFVHAPEACQRLPELALLAGSMLSYAAATTPPIPSGFWDRHPRPTAGRFRRALACRLFPHTFPLASHIRVKQVRTDHLRTGCGAQRTPTSSSTPSLAA